MRPENKRLAPQRPNLRKPQQGMGLVTAVFVILVMSLLGFASNQLFRSGANTSTQNLLSARALYAANSGLQAALSGLMVGGDACVTNQFAQVFTGNGLRGCEVTVSCQTISADLEDGTTINAYQLTGQGRCLSSNLSAVRVMEVLATP